MFKFPIFFAPAILSLLVFSCYLHYLPLNVFYCKAKYQTAMPPVLLTSQTQVEFFWLHSACCFPDLKISPDGSTILNNKQLIHLTYIIKIWQSSSPYQQTGVLLTSQ